MESQATNPDSHRFHLERRRERGGTGWVHGKTGGGRKDQPLRLVTLHPSLSPSPSHLSLGPPPLAFKKNKRLSPEIVVLKSRGTRRGRNPLQLLIPLRPVKEDTIIKRQSILFRTADSTIHQRAHAKQGRTGPPAAWITRRQHLTSWVFRSRI